MFLILENSNSIVIYILIIFPISQFMLNRVKNVELSSIIIFIFLRVQKLFVSKLSKKISNFTLNKLIQICGGEEQKVSFLINLIRRLQRRFEITLTRRNTIIFLLQLQLLFK